jgi:glycosyltransferase involved in cell wall biosynthesis
MILILTYAKVSTTSTTHLLSERFPGKVYRSHGFGAWLHEPLTRIYAANPAAMRSLRPFHDEAPAIASRLADALATREPVTIITGVRDPIARSLSVAMQNFEDCFMDCMGQTPEETAAAVAARIADLWVNDTQDDDPVRQWLEVMIRAPFRWFQEEIEKTFGFDLKEQQFDRDRGYAIFAKENVRLLLFRQENIPSALEHGLAELFPDTDVTLPHINDGSDKDTGDIYRALQACFRLPRDVLERIYAHPDIRAYYSEDEIAAAINRWAEVPPPRTWAAPPLPAAPRPQFTAAVFMPVHNHAAWVGGQLESLFDQWRPDVELVLVDDGSTDGSFNVALNRLNGRPNVAATIMRNSTSICHDMLPHIVGLTKAPIIIQSDSDDITLPGRLDAIINHFTTHPDCKLITTNAVLINESGVPMRLLDNNLPEILIDDPIKLIDLQGNPYWLGASSAYHRSLIEDFAPMDAELCPYGFDLLTGFRAVLLGVHHYLPRPYVGWRQHARNSHRLVGTTQSDPASLELMNAIYVMVKAQRLRDLAWLRAHGRIDPARAATIEARWQTDFMSKADEWIRLRNRLAKSQATPESRLNTSLGFRQFIPDIPPIVTLLKGFEYSIKEIFHALAFRSGVHLVSAPISWVGQQAILARQTILPVRIPQTDAQEIILTVSGLPYLESQRLQISVDFTEPTEITLDSSRVLRISVPIVRKLDPTGSIVTLLITSPDAQRHNQFSPEADDDRSLGVCLFTLEVA